MKLEVTTLVRDGHLSMPERKILADAIKRMEGKRVKVTLQLARKKISHKQHGYYRAVVLPMVYHHFQEMGNDMTQEQVHHHLKAYVGKLLETVTINGEEFVQPRSMASLTTEEDSIFMEKIRAWAAEFDLQIPQPNEGNYEIQTDN